MSDNQENQKPNSGDSTEAAAAATGTEEVKAAAGEEAAPAEDKAAAELAALRQELTETKDRMLRVAAEADNYKKRMEREKEAFVKYAGENILRELLTTLDNLERALEQGTAATADIEKKHHSMLEGLELTRKGLLSMLEKFEVTALNSVGQEFNPNEQEALTMAPSNEVPANHVLNEFVKGFRFKDRLLRAAKVVVSSGPAAA